MCFLLSRSEKPAKIFETLQEASDYMGELRNHVHADTFWYREAARVEYRLAQYANKLYINIEARMRSPEQIRTREFMDKQSKEERPSFFWSILSAKPHILDLVIFRMKCASQYAW